jgi:hypothetical protein
VYTARTRKSRRCTKTLKSAMLLAFGEDIEDRVTPMPRVIFESEPDIADDQNIRQLVSRVGERRHKA